MIGITVLLLAAIGAARVVKVSIVGVRLACSSIAATARRLASSTRTVAAAVVARSSPDLSLTTLALMALVAVLVAMRGSK